MKIKYLSQYLFVGGILLILTQVVLSFHPFFPTNNYYEVNEKSIKYIVNYLTKNDIDGLIYGDTDKYKNAVDNVKGSNCFFNKSCKTSSEILELVKKLDIDFLSTNKKEWYIVIGTKLPIYWDKKNEIYYKKWFYKNKKVWDYIYKNSKDVLIKKFNDDYGVINWYWD